MSTESPPKQMSPQLGECELIAHLSVEENGFYKVNDETAVPIFSSMLQDVRLDLGPRVRQIEKQRPFRYFQHPKHLDCIIAGCIASGMPHLFTAANGVVTWRGILTKIFLWEKINLHASWINGTLFLEEEDPKPKWRARRYAESDAVGKAFEDLYTTSHSTSTLPPSSTNNHHSSKQWGNVVTRTLGDLKLIFCGEVDAVKDQYDSQGDWFSKRVELKSKLVETSIPDQRWHMQSYLLGVPEIFVGYRSKNMKILRTQMMQVSEIHTPNLAAQFERGYNVLSALRNQLEKDRNEGGSGDDIIWKVTIQSGRWSYLHRLDDSEALKVKKRREDPSRPIRRVGIVPEDMMHRIRESV
ncbi:hypothetical protein VNI00_004694 [Paramarasmius palmivorus]|uniref:Decapping nuclease n=1 Tax=Paramarasmius palmivorus TaxID=297713 RepID=A0AAW0DKC8_9AGAR